MAVIDKATLLTFMREEPYAVQASGRAHGERGQELPGRVFLEAPRPAHHTRRTGKAILLPPAAMAAAWCAWFRCDDGLRRPGVPDRGAVVSWRNRANRLPCVAVASTMTGPIARTS